MQENYQPQQLEPATQQYWEQQQCFKAIDNDTSKEKFYCLAMFPYPSGKLHMGHVRNYTLGDVIARYQRMLGKNVLQPMGWDAFGLPAENAAIKHKIAPAHWTYPNIKEMRKQFKDLGFAYDWQREIATCKPEYYRWEQWFFTKLYAKGLVYKKKAMVNWDPVDQTILANEQVINGRGWRSGELVERREIAQWFLKITDYADQLLTDLKELEQWPQEVRTMQQNWIGRSEGAAIFFAVANHPDTTLEIFTTRSDTLMGTTYLAIAPQHPLAEQAAKTNAALQNFLTECHTLPVAEAAIATMEKLGMDTGLKAIHPITGAQIPIWVANFVIMDYGTGAVMAVPGHDQRDFEFAQKYNLPIQQVIQAADHPDHDFSQSALTTLGTLVNSGEFSGLTSAQAFTAIAALLEKNNKGHKVVNYRLRDWSISRQRYWGTPVPIINCPDCGAVAVPEHDLPVVLPEEVEFTGATSPLRAMPEFYQTTCPHCGKAAERETDTFDTFIESSWYYTRFACPDLKTAMLDERANYWTPVDQYVGGIEHAVMHLLYARFFHKLMRDCGLLNSNEPFTRLLTQGMVLKDGAKMSKSRGNVVDPKELIDKYGADTVRLFVIFAAPPEQSLEWSDSGVEGSHRFLKRLWAFCYAQQALIKHFNQTKPVLAWHTANDEQRNIRRQIHEILHLAQYDFNRQQFNTVVSGSMKLLHLLNDTAAKFSQATDQEKIIWQQIIFEGLSFLLRLLSPIVPHISHVLWQELGFPGIILTAGWPEPDETALKSDTVELVIQINGKLRGHLTVPTAADEATIKTAALQDENVQRYLVNGQAKKIIVVPGRLINIVV